MKRIFLSAALISLTSTVRAQDAATTTLVNKFQSFYNSGQADSVFNLFSERVKSMLPLDKTAQMVTQMQNQLGKLQTIEYRKTDNALTYYKVAFEKMDLLLVTALEDGKFQSFRFMPDNEVVNKVTSNAMLEVATGKLYGTLTVPDGTKKVPVVLIIAGSGPTDRDCNNNIGLKTNAFKMMADSLKAAGIACLRYDKRGIGESGQAMTSEENLRIDSFVNDAISWIKYLKKDNRFSEVIVAGHSEGSLIGMLAVQKEKIGKYISIAGSGVSLDKTIGAQLDELSPALTGQAHTIMDSLHKGYTAKNVPDGLMNLFRPAIQPYLSSELFLEPATELKKVKVPILIIQGSRDLQVTEANAQVLKKAAPAATMLLLPEMNHCLKNVPADRSSNFASYANPNLPLSEGLMTAVINFIKGK